MSVQPVAPRDRADALSMFTRCVGCVRTADIIFCFPDTEFTRDADEVCERLQTGYDLLREICPRRPHPTERLGGPLRVGYRHRTDPGETGEPDAGYWGPDRRINVPWARLKYKEDFPISVAIADQPEFCCSHELVHPFEEIFLKSNRNKIWKEAFCDCLRVFVLNRMGFKDFATKFSDFIEYQRTARSHCEYHDGAGRIMHWLSARVGDWDKASTSDIQSELQTLIACVMKAELDCDIRFDQDCKCKPAK